MSVLFIGVACLYMVCVSSPVMGSFFSQEQLVGNRAMPTTGKVAQELLEESISARRWVRSLMEGLPAGADAASTQALQPKLP
jgi:hypothetical protein